MKEMYFYTSQVYDYNIVLALHWRNTLLIAIIISVYKHSTTDINCIVVKLDKPLLADVLYFHSLKALLCIICTIIISVKIKWITINNKKYFNFTWVRITCIYIYLQWQCYCITHKSTYLHTGYSVRAALTKSPDKAQQSQPVTMRVSRVTGVVQRCSEAGQGTFTLGLLRVNPAGAAAVAGATKDSIAPKVTIPCVTLQYYIACFVKWRR